MRTCFFIPYAGSLGYSSTNWAKQYENNMNIVMIKYSGRGSREGEEFAKTWKDLIDDVYQQIVIHIDDGDYILFGHSMGAIVAYEIYYKLYENNMKLPCHIYFSGSNPPNMVDKRLCNVDEDEFRSEIIALGGIPEVILKSTKMLNMVISIVRKDLYLLQSYKFCKRDKGLICPVTIIIGIEDSLVNYSKLWGALTDNTCEFIYLTGGHFSILKQTKQIMEMLNNN